MSERATRERPPGPAGRLRSTAHIGRFTDDAVRADRLPFGEVVPPS